MNPLPRPTPLRNLVSYWNESRLRADQAVSTSVRPAPGTAPWRAALEDVLKIGYGLQTQSRFVGGVWERMRWRTIPSAGALYPCEVIASVMGEGSWRWDVEQGRLLPCGLPPLGADDLARAGLVLPPGERVQALLILLARPWLSMKKYRQRGYAYCHLDVGHAAANLALYAGALGVPPTLHLRFSRTVLAEHLQLDGLCREPLAVLSFAAAGPPAEAPAGTGPRAVAAGAAGMAASGLEGPDQREIENWESLQGILSLDSELALPCPPASAALLREPAELDAWPLLTLPAGRPPLGPPAEWRAAILGRRSAKGFRSQPLTLAQIGELLAALRADGLAADCPPDGATRLGVRLVARNVEGLSGVFAYSPEHHALSLIDPEAGDPRPACMQQEIAGRAAALLLLHAPVCGLVYARGYSAFTELLFHAAQLGQRLHLAAARLPGVGITCVGGFDDERCSHLARLDPEDEAVYVILLGVPDDSAVKHDRLNVAFSHGFTTREG